MAEMRVKKKIIAFSRECLIRPKILHGNNYRFWRNLRVCLNRTRRRPTLPRRRTEGDEPSLSGPDKIKPAQKADQTEARFCMARRGKKTGGIGGCSEV